VGLIYDPMKLLGVTIAMSGVARMIQMVSELTIVISRARTGQLKRIQ
jgi:hypothetical protein